MEDYFEYELLHAFGFFSSTSIDVIKFSLKVSSFKFRNVVNSQHQEKLQYPHFQSVYHERLTSWANFPLSYLNQKQKQLSGHMVSSSISVRSISELGKLFVMANQVLEFQAEEIINLGNLCSLALPGS